MPYGKFEFDHSELRGKIVTMFRTQTAFAASIGCTFSTVNHKINGSREFTREEIVRWCVALDIPLNEIPKYFFELKNADKEKD